jgi:hypothetical protein
LTTTTLGDEWYVGVGSEWYEGVEGVEGVEW